MAITEQKTGQGASGIALAPIVNINSNGDGDDNGLTEIVKNHTVQNIEAKREVKVEHTSKTMAAIEQFRKALALDESKYYPHKFKTELEGNMTDVLTPSEISIVFQAMLYETEDYPTNKGGITNKSIEEIIGMFTTQLIQLSYNAGYNEFILVTENSQRWISNIGYRLYGNKKQIVRTKIVGNASNLGGYSSYCEFDINGEVESKNSAIPVTSECCIFIFRGNSTTSCDASKSIYKTTNHNLLTTLIFNVPHGDYNQIVFINPDGTEEAVLRHSHDPSTGVFVNMKYYHGKLRDVLDSLNSEGRYRIIQVDNLQIEPIIK